MEHAVCIKGGEYDDGAAHDQGNKRLPEYADLCQICGQVADDMQDDSDREQVFQFLMVQGEKYEDRQGRLKNKGKDALDSGSEIFGRRDRHELMDQCRLLCDGGFVGDADFFQIAVNAKGIHHQGNYDISHKKRASIGDRLETSVPYAEQEGIFFAGAGRHPFFQPDVFAGFLKNTGDNGTVKRIIHRMICAVQENGQGKSAKKNEIKQPLADQGKEEINCHADKKRRNIHLFFRFIVP